MKDAIYEAITDIDHKYIEKAATTKLKSQKRTWQQYLAFAAVFCCIIGGGWWSATLLASKNAPAEGDGDGGHQTGTIFNFYAGPVFPLTIETDQDGMTATREIGFDFAPYTTGDHKAIVTDSYVLTNTTDRDQTLQLSYPVYGNLRDDVEIFPTITVDGREVTTTMKYGGYTGRFYDTMGQLSEGPETAYNFYPVISWEEFESLLGDGNYRYLAQNPKNWATQPVTVYRFTEHQGFGNASDIYVTYENPANATVLTQWFNGGGYDDTTGEEMGCYSIREASRKGADFPRYLIVLGVDIENIKVTGYTREDDKLLENPSVTAKMERYETDVISLLHEITPYFIKDYKIYEDIAPMIETMNHDDFSDLVLDNLYKYGMLSETPYARYQDGRLSPSFEETVSMDRILYTTFPITIPAGHSVPVNATMVKEASFDYYGSGTGNEDLHGFDMMTTVDSNLNFTDQTATIDTQGAVEITHQNFGFDLEHGIIRVTLDTAQPHYYLEVKKHHRKQ